MTPTFDHQLVIGTLEGILQGLGISDARITVSELGGSTCFGIQSADSALRTGQGTEVQEAITTLTKRMLETKIPHEARYLIDINGYHAQKIKSLEDNARVVAERVRTFKYDIDMPVMNAYERMIVHTCLKAMPDIDTTSVGEGPLRHIVVRLKGTTAAAVGV